MLLILELLVLLNQLVLSRLLENMDPQLKVLPEFLRHYSGHRRKLNLHIRHLHIQS